MNSRLLCVLVTFSSGLAILHADTAAGGPRLLFDPGAPGAGASVKPNDGSEAEVFTSFSKDGIDVVVPPSGKSSFPGIKILPSPPWDARGYGHLETRVTNNGPKPIRVNLRIDNEGAWQENRWSANVVTVKPGESKVVAAIFGYQYGKAGYALQPDAISSAIVFVGKSDVEQGFRVEQILAAGPAGEKPFVDPNTVATKPPGGMLRGGEVVTEAKQIVEKGGAKAALTSSGAFVEGSFSGRENEEVLFRPAAGFWNLNQYLQVRLRVKNLGAAPAVFKARLESRGGPSDVVSSEAVAPDQEGEIIVPFLGSV